MLSEFESLTPNQNNLMKDSESFMPIELSNNRDKERMAKKLVRKSEHELWAEPRFHDTYELVCFQLSDTGVFRYFTFFKRKDSILKVKEAENEACEGLE